MVDVRFHSWRKRKATPTTLPASSFISISKQPILLRVCSESRALALRHYELAFAKATLKDSSPPQIYVDFSIDTIWFDHLAYYPRINPSRPWSPPYSATDLSKIRFLAMRHQITRASTRRAITAEHFPALEVINVVTGYKMRPYPVIFRPNYRYIDHNTLQRESWNSDKKCPAIQRVYAERNYYLPFMCD